jgi:hypothetical protein
VCRAQAALNIGIAVLGSSWISLWNNTNATPAGTATPEASSSVLAGSTRGEAGFSDACRLVKNRSTSYAPEERLLNPQVLLVVEISLVISSLFSTNNIGLLNLDLLALPLANYSQSTDAPLPVLK